MPSTEVIAIAATLACLVLAAVVLIQARGQGLLAWGVVILCVGLLFAHL